MANQHDRSLYDGLHSATNRNWGPDRSNNAYSYGYEGQGGYGESQGPDAQSGHVARGHRGRGPQGYVRSDARIDASEILVMVEGGVVTLTGNVPERRMKHRAEDTAADASGVTDVRNTIRVDSGSDSFGRPGEAVRSGNDQLGSAFSSSARPDPVWDNVPEDSNWHPGPPQRKG